MSLRTKDSVSLTRIPTLIYACTNPTGITTFISCHHSKSDLPNWFLSPKTRQLLAICALLLKNYDGAVPNTYEELISLPGVGPKTTSLVLSEGFNIPAICVDTHVHRISNRLGLVKTKTPEQTEAALKLLLPKKYWSEYNKLMVMGQNICVPISPNVLCVHCFRCVHKWASPHR